MSVHAMQDLKIHGVSEDSAWSGNYLKDTTVTEHKWLETP